ncbi:UDP-N-acetylmuramate dehydrogenase [Patescibacteria group bacterium]|nr:UDP-N-acetylmuramate dehydrogenase [Patescibacteria group bacterium]
MIEGKIEKNINLAPLTTFKIGGPAKYFCQVKTEEELIQVIKWAKKKKIPYFVIGGGSNLLISDKGFKGLVIKLSMEQCQLVGNKLLLGSALRLSQTVMFLVKNNLTGLEWAAGIPGTVGGAVRGNAGAFGQEISNCLLKVTVLREGEVIELKNKEIRFAYRQSIFKKNKDIILNVVLSLKKGKNQENEKIIQDILQRRRKSHPSQPSAGCVFKNPKLSSAGLLIDKCGLKGRQIGGAKISEKHANFIINTGQAKARDVKNLIELIKKQVKDKFNIELKEEIEYLG